MHLCSERKRRTRKNEKHIKKVPVVLPHNNYGIGPVCGNADDGIAINKPTNLKASRISGGIVLTWQDNSEDEDYFLVFRKEGFIVSFQADTIMRGNDVLLHSFYHRKRDLFGARTGRIE